VNCFSSKLAAVLRKLHGATVTEISASSTSDVKPLSPGDNGVQRSELNSVTSPIDITSELNSPSSDQSISEHCTSTALDPSAVFGDKVFFFIVLWHRWSLD
jgi:hypothetical protein